MHTTDNFPKPSSYFRSRLTLFILLLVNQRSFIWQSIHLVYWEWIHSERWFYFQFNSNISHQLRVVFRSVKVAWRSWFSIPLAHLNPYVVWKLPRNNLINTIRKTKNSLKQRYNVIFVSAQVLLVLTLGLWTFGLRPWAWQLLKICEWVCTWVP